MCGGGERHIDERARDAERDDFRQCVGGQLQQQDAARVLVDEQDFVGQRREALAHAGLREVHVREVRRGEAWRHAERGADVHRERRRLRKRRLVLARRIRQLVPPQRGEIQADVAEHVEGGGKSVAGVAFGQQRDDVHVAFVAQLRLQIAAGADHVGPIVLREVEILELRVDVHEGTANPAVEGVRVVAHAVSLPNRGMLSKWRREQRRFRILPVPLHRDVSRKGERMAAALHASQPSGERRTTRSGRSRSRSGNSFSQRWRHLIGAPAGTLTAAENVTTALYSIIGALPDPILAGRKLLIAADCFPSLHFLLSGMAERRGFELTTVALRPGESWVRDEDFMAHWGPDVGVALLTWVTSTASHRCSLRALVEHGRAMGSLVGVDITQGVGIVPFDLRALDLDFVVVHSLKWLCGVSGAGVLQVREGC